MQQKKVHLHQVNKMTASPKSNEHELIEGCRKNKGWAQKAVYDIYAPAMYAVCLRYCNNADTAKDLLQDAFILIFSKINSYNGDGAFGGWIRRIVVTTALGYLRQQHALKHYEEIEDYTADAKSNEPSAIDSISVKELMECIGQLPIGYRTVFNLYAIEGYSHAEIAEQLNISENTSRSQYMRARNTLQKAIEKLTGDDYSKQYGKQA